ncbi:MAG: D-glucuronyl C5-epimerase family protein [Candidatus Cloacimonetes bacterium]|nr:D-glucuronyl C5-epimerase family protein [Candidatus Cloacimonadota bacterium]
MWKVALIVMALLLLANCDTNQSNQGILNPNDNESAFLNREWNPLSMDLKRNPISNAAEKAQQYLQDGMLYVHSFNFTYVNLGDDMVPIHEYSHGLFYNPVEISCFSFSFWRDYHTHGDEFYINGFRACADFLVDWMTEDGYMPYYFDWGHYPCADLPSPWVSGMAQGQNLATLSRAYHHFGEDKYLQAMNKIYRTMYSNIGDFWVVGFENDYYWIEEYPSPNFCHVLNGMMYALWGLWDYYAVTGEIGALRLLEAGIRSIIDHHMDWNMPGENMTTYCTGRNYATSESYDSYHRILITRFNERFQIPELLEVLQDWEQL